MLAEWLRRTPYVGFAAWLSASSRRLVRMGAKVGKGHEAVIGVEGLVTALEAYLQVRGRD